MRTRRMLVVKVFESGGAHHASDDVVHMVRRAVIHPAVPVCMAVLFEGCKGSQSALDPAGRGAERIAALFWWMAGGAGVIWLAVIALIVYAFIRNRRHSERTTSWLIVGGGIVGPIVILTVVLIAALTLLPELLAQRPGEVRIVVSGEQWWWRVRYLLPDGEQVELANELRIPVGERVEVLLSSPDVIHAFWVPSIAGKMDMIPGRVNRLILEPVRTGVFLGVCAEYCGASHAFMAFDVVVVEKNEFARWLERQRQPATNESRGHELFLRNGCGACHTIRGTAADGVIGPDLTHVGSRRLIAAGILPNDRRMVAQFITKTSEIKPGVRMPHFGMLPPDEIEALAEYLEALQ